jgi:hypothetical protein
VRRYDPIVRIARLVAAIAVATGMGAADLAFAGAPGNDVSPNWAGYAVTKASFRSVSATWKQPTVRCGTNDRGARSSVWVGLGGYGRGSHTLEQIGSASDCGVTTGRPRYYAWYEIPPAPGIVLQLPVAAGDIISAKVAVNGAGTLALFTIENRTRGVGYTTSEPVRKPDLSSAEWIVEAPSRCGAGCGTPRLADFGSVSFTQVAAFSAGHVGTIVDRSWQATAVRMLPSLLAGAAPKALAPDGTSFTVVWQGGGSSTPAPAAKPASPLVAGPRRP